MGKIKRYRTMKIEEEIFLNFSDYKRIFELENKRKTTFSELLLSLIKNKPIKLKNLPIEI